MGKRDIIASLDIGTSVVRIIIGEINSGTFNIIGIGREVSKGMRKGVVVDIDSVAQSITIAREQAERMAGVKVFEVYVGLPVSYVNIFSNRGIVAVTGPGKEISITDVERVLQAARVVAVPQNKEIVDVIPTQFLLDGHEGIQDPVGMVGVRLEVETLLISAKVAAVQNIVRCVEKADLNVADFILHPLAEAEVCLTDDEKELGVALVNVGAGTTEISIFKNGFLDKVASIPLGGDHLTNDIAAGLRVTQAMAETIKLEYGSIDLERVDDDEERYVEIAGAGQSKTRSMDIHTLSNIIESRVEEIYDYIRKELQAASSIDALVSGIVMTGGVKQMEGFPQFGEQYLKIPIRTSAVEKYGVDDPLATIAIGIVIYAAKYKQAVSHRRKQKATNRIGFFARMFSWLKELWE